MALSPVDAEFQPAAGDGEATLFHCALCGCRFTHGGQVCGACPMSSGCDLVRCPACGYQFPRGSQLVGLVRRLARRLRRRA